MVAAIGSVVSSRIPDREFSQSVRPYYINSPSASRPDHHRALVAWGTLHDLCGPCVTSDRHPGFASLVTLNSTCFQATAAHMQRFRKVCVPQRSCCFERRRIEDVLFIWRREIHNDAHGRKTKHTPCSQPYMESPCKAPCWCQYICFRWRVLRWLPVSVLALLYKGFACASNCANDLTALGPAMLQSQASGNTRPCFPWIQVQPRRVNELWPSRASESYRAAGILTASRDACKSQRLFEKLSCCLHLLHVVVSSIWNNFEVFLKRAS